jgi:MFS family permease
LLAIDTLKIGGHMETTIAPTTRLFPRGTTTLAIAAALAALGHFMTLACLYSFVTGALGLSPDEGRVAWNAYTAATVLFYVVGGVWGDFGGHRRNLIIGPSITIAALLLLLITPDSANGGAVLLLLVAMSSFACGRSLFAVASGTLAAHLFEEGGGRVPLAGSYTLLHMAANTAVLLLAPFASTSIDAFLGDAVGMSRDESQRLVFALAAQPAICALILCAVAKRTFAAAELAVRSKAAAPNPPPFDDGAVGYRRTALGLLVAAAALGVAAYDAAMSGAFELASHVGEGAGSEWFGAMQLTNGAIVVFLAPIAVIVYGRMRRGDGRVATAGVAVVGATLIGLGLTILLAASAMLPESPSEFAPPWLEDAPSIAWPIAAQILVSLGEILFIPLMSTLFASLAPRRLRGLFLGIALALTGFMVLSTRLVGDAFDGIPLTASAALALAAAVACAALLAVVGTVFRKREA